MLSEFQIERCKGCIHNLRGFDRTEFVEADQGHFVLRAHPGKDCANEYDNAHGGYLLALVDMAAAGAADTDGRPSVTMQVSASFVRPVPIDIAYFDVHADTIHAGKKTIVVDVQCVSPDDKLLLKAIVTMAITGDAPAA